MRREHGRKRPQRSAIVHYRPVADPLRRALPATRADCPIRRPCPYVTCRHHLALDTSRLGRVRWAFPDLDPTEVPCSCSLDLAERGGMTLEEIGDMMNLTRERVRQLLRLALRAYYQENLDG